jgi:hypothetical protein
MVDGQVVHVQRGGQLRANETAADHQCGFPFDGGAAQLPVIGQGAVIADAFEITSWNEQTLRRCSGRQQEALIAICVALTILDRVMFRAESLDLHAQTQLDPIPHVERCVV